MRNAILLLSNGNLLSEACESGFEMETWKRTEEEEEKDK